ncbi:MAG: basic amino acid ABC transporter substrate-binding protein [Dehalococcoidales bacterium]
MKKLVLLGLILVMLSTLVVTSCSSGPTKIRVATDATWAPFEFVNDKTNQIEGFDIDLLNAIAAKENLDIEYVNVAFDALLAGMAQGMYDCAISSITITTDRAKDMLFSDPYFFAGQIVTVRKDNTTITGKDTLTGAVGAQLGTTGAMEVEKLSGVTLKTYDDIGLAFQDLMNGQINAVVCDNPVAMGYVAKNANTLKIVGKVFTDENYGIAIAKGKTDLLAKINTGIAAIIKDGLIATLSAKWLEK